ncbi:plasmalemma vesicle-associated protein-like [Narcine bancroftii]|uniref:plasmalemma vesicle-associated protein-like n=1 Tax=Narcine bancroftii TaxID=1343680 RepID=UPI003831D657
MDHNSYPMKKLGYNTKEHKKVKSNSCSFYVRYCLLCTSVIQMLIILGLVLFMIYGSNHESQQSQLLNSQNQSMKLIDDINKVQSILAYRKKELKNCLYKSGNLTIQLSRINKTCIIRKNFTIPRNNFPFLPYFQGSTHDVKFNNLLRNYSSVQTQLAKLKADHELEKAKQILEVVKLNGEKRELVKQLKDLNGNCTSLSRDFQIVMDNVKKSYEHSFKSLSTRQGLSHHGFNSQLELIKANCSPLSTRFQKDIQQKLKEFDTNHLRMWQINNEQKLKIDTLERVINDCQQDTAKKLNEFTKKESKLHEDVEKYMAERVHLLEERNSLRNQLAVLKNINPHANILFNHRGQSLASSCHTQLEIVTQMDALLEVKNRLLADKEQEIERLKQQLNVQNINCLVQIEKQKQSSCRASG